MHLQLAIRDLCKNGLEHQLDSYSLSPGLYTFHASTGFTVLGSGYCGVWSMSELGGKAVKNERGRTDSGRRDRANLPIYQRSALFDYYDDLLDLEGLPLCRDFTAPSTPTS